MSSDYFERIENRGARMYAAQQARGVQHGEVATFGGQASDATSKSDISAARSGRHMKYDMAAELKANGETKRKLLLCDYLFNDVIQLSMTEDWFDLQEKKNIKLLRAYCVLALEELSVPNDYLSDAARARTLELHPKTFIRNHRQRYIKVFQMLDDWALSQFVGMVRRVG